MFLNIGSDYSVNDSDVIAVISLEKNYNSIDFIDDLIKNSECVDLSEIHRSVIITEKDGRTVIYLSPVSTDTIKKRWLDVQSAFSLEK